MPRPTSRRSAIALLVGACTFGSWRAQQDFSRVEIKAERLTAAPECALSCARARRCDACEGGCE
jgi:hypothetical protein